MMNTLFESSPQKKRTSGGTIFSIAFHTGIVLFAVFATARAGIVKDEAQKAEKVNFVKTAEPPKPVEKKAETPPPPPKVKKPVQQHTAKLPPAPKAEIAPPKGFKVLQAPIAISNKIPVIDLSAKVTNEADFSGKGVRGGSATGKEASNGTKEGAGAGIDTNKNYAEYEVERQVSAISGTNIPYPEGMRSSGTEGRVMAQFVVNESGRVETGTFKILDSTNDFFTQAVRNALSRMRFRPAQIGKTNVSQVVQQAFVFQLNK